MISRFKPHLKLKQLLLLLTVCFITRVNTLQAQCTGCTTVIATNSAANFTVNTGVTMCINAGVTYSGNITLNGGTVCNSGTITNITFLKGTFNNYKVFNRNSAITANITGNTTINCYALSTFTVTGAFNVTATTDAFQMNINIERQAQFKLSSNLAHNKGVMNITVGVNGTAVTGQETLLSIGGALTASNAEFNLTNERESTVNITGTTGLNNKFHKRIYNRGTFNANGAFSIGGDAVSSGTVFIENRSNFNINNSLTASLANGTVSIVNEANYTFNINTSMTIAQLNHTFTNKGNLTVGTDIIMTGGLLVNNSSVRVRDLDVRAARVTNNSQLNVLRNLLAITTTAIVDNNAYINITNKLSNKAVFNLGTSSLIKVDSCINTGTTAFLKGPTTATVLTDYARLVVKGVSQTDGFVNGYLRVHDLSLTSNTTNINYGFDKVTNPTRIASTVTFATRGVAPGNGNPSVSNCAVISSMYVLQASALSSLICQGGCTNLTANLSDATLLLGGTLLYTNIDPTLLTFTWQAGNLVGQSVSVCPTSSRVYTANTNYSGCSFTNTVAISLSSLSVDVNPNTIVIQNGSTVNLQSIVTPGIPTYNYEWLPNQFFTSGTNNTQANPIVNPSQTTNYKLTVRDANGCTSKDSVLITVSPFDAVVKKIHADYFNPVNGKVSLFNNTTGLQTGIRAIWLDLTNSRNKEGLAPGSYTVSIFDSLTQLNLTKVIDIGLKPYWIFKKNVLIDSTAIIKPIRQDSLGILLADNTILSEARNLLEFKINSLTERYTIGYIGSDTNLSYADSAYADSARKVRVNLAYNLANLNYTNGLPYSGNLLNLAAAYKDVNLISIEFGTLKVLFKNASSTALFNYQVNDLIQIGRNASGALVVIVNNIVIYTHTNLEARYSYLQPIVLPNKEDMNARAIGVITPIVPLIILPKVYTVPTFKKDGGYYTAVNGQLLFKTVGEYNKMPIQFKIFNAARAVVMSNIISLNAINSIQMNTGDNRYELNVSSLSVGYYTLELTNEKKEKKYLRFRIAPTIPNQ
jgi:hypothetical protein